jgi:tetratricopeptide (TPR) repeat protein
MTWNFVEIVDSDDFYLYQEWSPLLNGLTQVGNFGILAPIAALGVALTWKERRRLIILYALILTMAFSVALFYVFGRYRLPLVPMLALFAGAAVVRISALIRSRKLGLLLSSLAIAVLAWFVVHRPIVGSPGPTVAGYSNLARVFAKTGKPDEAIANYKRALQIEPQSAEVQYNLGSLLGMRGNIQEAKQHLEEAVKIQPGYAEAHSNLGNVFSMQGNPKIAVEHYRKALEIDPTFDDTRFNLGMALLYLKDFSGAAEQFQLIIKKRPDFAEGHFLLGNAYAAGGRLSEAIGEFRATLRLKPDLADGHIGLARALAMTGRKDEAAQHYQRALTLLKAQRQPEAKEK